MRSSVVRELERRIEEVGPGSRSPTDAARDRVPTGIAALDGLLPRGGLPRGQPVEWLGPRSCGKTALLHAALGRLLERGESVAVVDGGRTFYAPDWVDLAGSGAFWVIRPPEHREALWCADLLLRSGAFGAVALDAGEGSGGDPRSRALVLPRSPAVRLQRLAEESGALWIVVGELPLAALRLRFRPARVQPVGGPPFGPFLPLLRPMWVGVGKGDALEVPILCPVPLPVRSRPLPSRDRKGPR